MKVKRIVSYYARPATFTTGGVNTSRQQWMKALSDAGQHVVLINAAGGHTTNLIGPSKVELIELNHWGRRRTTMIPRGLSSLLKKGDLVYLHEGWTISNLVVAAICRLRKIPYVVLPHGVYDPQLVQDLRAKQVRKFFERWLLKNAHAVHLFFDTEAGDIEALAPGARTVVAVTGLDVPAKRWNRDQESPYLAWLARYDIHHKGIDVLLDAMSMIPEARRPLLVMHGPDHRGDFERVRQQIEHLDLTGFVNARGPLTPMDAQTFVAGAVGFVHVPRWEAFGRTIAEALALGVPIVLGDGAEFSRVLSETEATIVPSGDPERIAAALEAIWATPPRNETGGRTWVANHLSWSTSANRLLSELGVESTRRR